MRIALVGSDYEENLGMAMVGASLLRAKHRVAVVPFNELDELDDTVERLLARRPRIVGLAAQFQHRAFDFLRLAWRLRRAGFRGHITCGGQWPTLTADRILTEEPAVDSVVLHEAEDTMVELADALAHQRDLAEVPGLALRDQSGVPIRTAPRRLRDDLDQLPFAFRYRRHTRQLGIPFIPMYSSRGCWGSCAYCAITTYYRDAREYGGARKLRLRSPDSVAAEMAALYHSVGGPCTFCFHDDTLLLPRPADTLERMRALRAALDEFGVGEVGIIGKAHPECVTPELARELARLGVMRMFLGVENVSQPGQDHLCRRTRTADIERAISSFDEVGIMVCYNLLLFEPDAKLADIAENIAFMRRYAHVPVNFCRAEPYHGTPLYQRMQQRGALNGCFLGWNYRIADDRTELLFRICASAFRDRNFDPRGVANRYIGTAYLAQLLSFYYDCSSVRGQRLLARVRKLVESVTHDTADLLAEALTLAETVDLADPDRVERETALLGLRVAAHDQVWHAELDDLSADIEAFAREQSREPARGELPSRLKDALQGVAWAGAMLAVVGGCGGETEDGQTAAGGTGGATGTGGVGGYSHTDGGSGGWVGDGGTGGVGGYYHVDGGSGGWLGDGGTSGWVGDGGDGGWVGDAVPGGAAGWLGDGGTGNLVVDPLPPPAGMAGMAGDAGHGAGGVAGIAGAPTGGAGGVAGTAPGGAAGTGRAGAGGRAGAAGAVNTGGFGNIIVDPPPRDQGIQGESAANGPQRSKSDATVEHWQDTSPRRAERTRDLAIYRPPPIALDARRDGDWVHVAICGASEPMSMRWEGDGVIDGDGRVVRWRPETDDDQIRVAVRTSGGVAITALRAAEVCGS